MSDFRQKLMASFEVEYKEHLSAIRGILAGSGDGKATAAADVQEAYRRAHSLKGAARAVELAAIESLAHRLETLFSKVQKSELDLEGETNRVINLVLDGIEDWMDALAGTENPPEPRKALNAIDQLLRSPLSDAIGGTAKPPPPMARDQESANAAVPRPKRTAESGTVRISSENLDRVLRTSGLLLAEGFQHENVGRTLRALNRQAEAIQRDAMKFRNQASPTLRRLAKLPEYARIARHIESADRQVQVLSKKLKETFQSQSRSEWTFRRLVGELEAAVREARMVPAESVFGGFRKMARDLASDEKKEIEVDVRGLQTQADRAILQSLKDPVMHLLRNAVKHGIESPADRKRRGKSPTGKVSVEVAARGSRLVVKVEDDGRGIDPSLIAKAATGQGFLSEDEAAAITPETCFRVLLQPGFTTATEVTNLAGRGMGLSVVHQTALRLQGNTEIRANRGEGMAVVISVPLSISSQYLLLCLCHGGTYGFSTESIERIHHIPEKDLLTVEGRPMVRLGDQSLPVIHLSDLLGLPGTTEAIGETPLPVVVLQSAGRRFAVAVDRFLMVRNTVVRRIDGNGMMARTISGAFTLDDGTVGLALSAAELVESATSGDIRPTVKSASRKAPPPAYRVLVVDDSITTRTLEKSILEAHGYHVGISVDGLDALRQLRNGPVDLVVADIQMPKMDGFVLLKELKKDKDLSRIPVILVTSCDDPGDRQRGLELGAEAYIVKQKFDQKELLETIRQLI